MSFNFRKERDSFGSIKVPNNALWGAQTQRALQNFAIGNTKMPLDLIYALARIKQSAAITNNRLGVLDETKAHLISKAASEIAQGMHDDAFPLSIWQSGSGTQTNMNLNEVISNLAAKATGNSLGSQIPIHPNDHVNQSQSTNDTFPAAIQIAVAKKIKINLLPELKLLIESLSSKSNAWSQIIKTGRTHLQDAIPLTLGQEVSAWRDQISTAYNRIDGSLNELYSLPLGGTAIGTGLNTPDNFDNEIVVELSNLFELPFSVAKNKFAIMASHDGLVNTMTQIKMLAVTFLKIVNDIRLLACGPRAGFAELQLPANEPGSSIMPGKVNPTQCEAMAMVCTQIMGLDTAVAMGGSGGHLQMNSYKPMIAFNLLESIQLLKDSCQSCRIKMIDGIEPNKIKIQEDLEQSLMLVTILAPEIGYQKASEIANLAYKKNISLREAAINLSYIDEASFDQIVNPSKMTGQTF